MEDIMEAWEIVFGEGAFDEILQRLWTACGIVGACLLVFFGLLLWKYLAGKAIRDAFMELVEYPDHARAMDFCERVKKVSALGRSMVKGSKKFADLSKNECRMMFNMNIVTSSLLTVDDLHAVRHTLMSLGITGLSGIISK